MVKLKINKFCTFTAKKLIFIFLLLLLLVCYQDFKERMVYEWVLYALIGIGALGYLQRTSWIVYGWNILINASEKRQQQIPSNIAHWNMKELASFNSKYLAGFVTEKYTIPLKEGHRRSFQEAKSIAHNWIRRDIGGDTQRIHQADIKLSEETFKHVLLPVYISSYSYSGKKYHFYINGQTGSIHGTRPYSFWKIFFLILFILLVIALIVVFAK